MTKQWSDNVSGRFVIGINSLRADRGDFGFHLNSSFWQCCVIQTRLLWFSVDWVGLFAIHGGISAQSFAVF